MKNIKDPSCSTCPFQEKICLSETGKGPENCPTLFMGDTIAYTTVFATKDRVLGHNPMAALYLSKSYYRRLSQKS